jgi:hypothetical protein
MASATPARKRDKASGEAEAASSRKRAKLTRRTYGKFEVEDRGPYVVARGVLSKEEVAEAERFFQKEDIQRRLEKTDLHTYDDLEGEFRKGKSCVVDGKTEVPWLFRRLTQVTKAADEKFGALYYCNGRLTPRYDELQYAEYHAGDHFGEWHTDAEEGGTDPEDYRDMTVVLMLSSEDAYTGGELLVKRGGWHGKRGGNQMPPAPEAIDNAQLRAGDACIFPANKVWHRVTPVQSGLRKSVVFWTSRPGGG